MKLRPLVACSLFWISSLVAAAEPEVAFLREQVSVTTRYGVTGLPPGTRVTIVSRHGSRMTIKSEDQQFDVSADQLTTDAEAARAMSARDAAERQAAQQQIQQQQHSAQQLAAQREAQLRDGEQRQRQAASPPDAKSALEAQIHDVQKQREKLEIELDRVHADQKQLPPPNEVRYTRYHTAWGNRRDGYIKHSDLTKC